MDYEYLLCSKAFEKCEYYIVAAQEDNYLHLTGVHTGLDAATFFEKCYKGTLEETDFDFSKKGQNENEVKGSVRRKINSLPAIMDMFNVGTSVEEDFTKNRIRCSLAATNISATLGFVAAGKAKPMTLLKGNDRHAITSYNKPCQRDKEAKPVLLQKFIRRQMPLPTEVGGHFASQNTGGMENLQKHKDLFIFLKFQEKLLIHILITTVSKELVRRSVEFL